MWLEPTTSLQQNIHTANPLYTTTYTHGMHYAVSTTAFNISSRWTFNGFATKLLVRVLRLQRLFYYGSDLDFRKEFNARLLSMHTKLSK